MCNGVETTKNLTNSIHGVGKLSTMLKTVVVEQYFDISLPGIQSNVSGVSVCAS